jgi:probable rRNA maturation factor
MPIKIQISRTLHLAAEQTRSLRSLLAQSAKMSLKNVSPTEKVDLSLVLSGDEQLRELNRSYRGIDAVTDVLSFSSGETDPESGRLYLGDILISYPQAVAQAAAGKHTVEAELQLLAVHGVLHLCGFDHVEMQDKNRMWEKQTEVLKLLDCPIISPMEEPN